MNEPSFDPLDLAAARDRLAELSDFASGPRERRVLLEFAGLGRFLNAIDLNGPPRIVAGDLLLRLARFGPLPENKTRHALGALLAYLLTLNDLPAESAILFAKVLVKYCLIRDRDYLERVRIKFGVPAPEFVQVEAFAPQFIPVPTDDPSFAPRIEDEANLERVIHSEDNFLDISLLLGALYCSQAVCRIEAADGRPLGTGVLIGPDLVITNQHVFKSSQHVEGSVARFDYKIVDGIDVPQPGRTFSFRNDFYESSPAENLDYAITRVDNPPLGNILPDPKDVGSPISALISLGKHRGYLELAPRHLKEGDRVNIIQHPAGNPLKVVMTQNYVSVDMTQTRVQYVADTMQGSSGSPVFNSRWELVAIHHSGAPFPAEPVGDTLKKAWKGKFRVNEGIPIKAILEDFKSRGFERHLPPKSEFAKRFPNS